MLSSQGLPCPPTNYGPWPSDCQICRERPSRRYRCQRPGPEQSLCAARPEHAANLVLHNTSTRLPGNICGHRASSERRQYLPVHSFCVYLPAYDMQKRRRRRCADGWPPHPLMLCRETRCAIPWRTQRDQRRASRPYTTRQGLLISVSRWQA